MQRRKKIERDKLAYEKEMLTLGAEYIAGVDEEGRGRWQGRSSVRRSYFPSARGSS